MVGERFVIVAVDDQITEREQVRLELEHRYNRDYDIVVEGTPISALSTIEALLASGRHVPVVLAGQHLRDLDGVEFLSRVHNLTPRTGTRTGGSRNS